MFYITYEYLKYEILKWVVHTKICTNENYSVYTVVSITYIDLFYSDNRLIEA